MSSSVTSRPGLSSVTNAFTVLEYLVIAGEAGVSDIARHVGVTVGTSHRLVGTLVSIGWAEQNPENRRYRPSQKLVALAQQMRTTLSAREIAHDHLTSLVQRVRETGNLAILSDQQVLYVDKVTSDQPFGLEARIGSRLPAYCTALGKVLVASLQGKEFDAYMSTLRKLRRAGRAPVPAADAAFRSELEQTRSRDYALDEGEYLPDVWCVASPIRAGVDSHVVASISVSAPRSRFVTNREQLIAEVSATATALSERLQALGVGSRPTDFSFVDLG